MPDVTGYVSVKNKCGASIENVRVSVSVGGTLSPLLQLPLLSDHMTSMNKKFVFPGGANSNWAVSFTLGGTQMDGTANCPLTSADNNRMVKITLSKDEFTITPTESDGATGMYDGQG